MKSKKTTLIIGLLLLAAIGTGVYAGAVPAVISSRYTEKVHAAVQPLRSGFSALGKSTELPLIVNPDAPETTKKSDAETIARLIAAARQNITRLKTASDDLVPMPYSTVLGQYGRASTLRDHTQRLVGQSQSALDDYGALTAYLETFDKATGSVISELDGFNAVSDINEYSGKSDMMRQTAEKIRANADLLIKAHPPSDMADMNREAIAALHEAAGGFDDLAYGLSIPADDPIYAAAIRIETATKSLEKVTGATYDDNINRSRTIRNVQDLSEKLELVAGQ